MILVYMDDIIVLSADDVHIDEVVTAFKTQYAMQDLGDLQHYLGITIENSESQIKLHQTAYAMHISTPDSSMLHVKLSCIPYCSWTKIVS